MFKIKIEYLIVPIICFFAVFHSCQKSNYTETKTAIVAKIENKKPVPIEFVERKKNRKEFKKSRKEYIDMIHKRGPDVDWKKMDSDFRKNRSYENTLLRQNYINQNGYWEKANSRISLS